MGVCIKINKVSQHFGFKPVDFQTFLYIIPNVIKYKAKSPALSFFTVELFRS